MKNIRFFITVLALIASGCTSIPMPKQSATQADARVLLDSTQAAHGKAAFAKITDINVGYDGEWFNLVTKLQPTLTDVPYRKSSQEHVLLKDQAVAQIHSGSTGSKFVLKTPNEFKLAYDGKPSTDKEKIDSSHVVLEAYQLFLYPAFYVERAKHLERLGTASVNGQTCDILLAILQPGLGNSAQDRVLLFIDQKDKLVKRIQATVEGFSGTQGATIEVTHNRFMELAGVMWPTHFFEAVIKPFPNLPAHDFWLTGLDVNRGLTLNDLQSGQYTGKAAAPAAALPTAFTGPLNK